MSETWGSSETEGSSADVQARMKLIEQLIEVPLTAVQADEVRQRIESSIALGNVLRAYPLTNADEPEIAFDPFIGGD